MTGLLGYAQVRQHVSATIQMQQSHQAVVWSQMCLRYIAAWVAGPQVILKGSKISWSNRTKEALMSPNFDKTDVSKFWQDGIVHSVIQIDYSGD